MLVELICVSEKDPNEQAYRLIKSITLVWNYGLVLITDILIKFN